MNENLVHPWQKRKVIIIAAMIIILAVAWYLTQNTITPLGKSFSSPLENNAGSASLGQPEIFPSAVNRAAAPAAMDATSETAADQQQLTTFERKVIKVGTLNLVVNQTEEAAAAIQKIAEGLGGLTQNVQIYGAGRDKKIGLVTVKVPVAKFNEAIDAIKQLADEVQNLTVTTNDATEQYIDLTARIKNMRAEEEQYQNILKQAAKIEDILQVTERLSNVRGRIEQAEGQLKYLSGQVDMSTITVNLSAEGDIEVLGVHWRPSITARQSIRNMLVSLTSYADAMIKLLFYLPVLLVWLVTIGIGLLILARVSKKAKQRFGK